MRLIGICRKVVGGLPQFGHRMLAKATLRNMTKATNAKAATHATYGKKLVMPNNGSESAAMKNAETRYQMRRDARRLCEHLRLHSARILGSSVARCSMAPNAGVKRRRYAVRLDEMLAALRRRTNCDNQGW